MCPRKLLTLILISMLATALAAVGCSRETRSPAPRPTGSVELTSPAPPAAQTMSVRLYFTRGEKIGVASRKVEQAGKPASQAFFAVQALLDGPSAEEAEFGLGTAIPPGTTLNGVEIAGGTATVDMSSGFPSGGGSLSMLLRVAQMVCTLTQFEGVENVAFKLDGTPVNAIGGEGVIVDPPVDRADFEDQLPAILVEYPTPGEPISSPLTISGSSNVFEAIHQLTLTDPDGLALVEKRVSASSGTGTRGAWSTSAEFGPVKRDGLGAVIVFALSPKDGSRIDIVEIPVRMAR